MSRQCNTMLIIILVAGGSCYSYFCCGFILFVSVPIEYLSTSLPFSRDLLSLRCAFLAVPFGQSERGVVAYSGQATGSSKRPTIGGRPRSACHAPLRYYIHSCHSARVNLLNPNVHLRRLHESSLILIVCRVRVWHVFPRKPQGGQGCQRASG